MKILVLQIEDGITAVVALNNDLCCSFADLPQQKSDFQIGVKNHFYYLFRSEAGVDVKSTDLHTFVIFLNNPEVWDGIFYQIERCAWLIYHCDICSRVFRDSDVFYYEKAIASKLPDGLYRKKHGKFLQ